MQAQHSTTEGRHDGIGIPSATRPFAVVKNSKNKQNEMTKTYAADQEPHLRGAGIKCYENIIKNLFLLPVIAGLGLIHLTG